MSSRFVPAGTDQSSGSSNDAWTKAKEQVETARVSKPIEKGKQEDGRSLYEVLQANKQAKQDAFEEATKVRNQFRALDDSEVEFLESIKSSEQQKEHAQRQETAAQLDAFRRQRLAVEQASLTMTQSKGDEGKIDQTAAINSWTSTKKRRRNDSEDDVADKVKSRIRPDAEYESSSQAIASGKEATSDGKKTQSVSSNISNQHTQENSVAATNKPSTALGLVDYGSDSDSD